MKQRYQINKVEQFNSPWTQYEKDGRIKYYRRSKLEDQNQAPSTKEVEMQKVIEENLIKKQEEEKFLANRATFIKTDTVNEKLLNSTIKLSTTATKEMLKTLPWYKRLGLFRTNYSFGYNFLRTFFVMGLIMLTIIFFCIYYLSFTHELPYLILGIIFFVFSIFALGYFVYRFL
ncbi:hypothetical protein J2Z62_000198 [Mycoplasmoides fastidiosum]|uniref:Uncharacterized protein n=1 Tax=Mycoplasmoides fastidiosum TaxID=92758 RepID=A0ABU0LYK2_9BACT|nr:ABC transporter permease [Mycoplasmoides fastidiosum]MDQ0513760.1 hypothetical protein [Mycoplasmoides fastidiosum]UUD37819.1 ABC transporter permease [Mycoplasmoides fastidiosum]